MEPKPSLLCRNLLTRILIIGLLALVLRFAYVITLRGGVSCDDVTSFCFFRPSLVSVPLRSSSSVLSDYLSTSSPPRVAPSRPPKKTVRFYSSVFQDLIGQGHFSLLSRSLCVETPSGDDVFSLREVGVRDSFGVSRKAAKPFVAPYGKVGFLIPFGNGTFDFVFSGGGRMDSHPSQGLLRAEVARVLKPGGVFVIHTLATRDEYSFNSFIKFFDCFKFVASREIEGLNQIVLKKIIKKTKKTEKEDSGGGDGKCLVPAYKRGLVSKAEKLIEQEPLKPWITLKKNIENVKYLPTMADISFKNRYVYVDVGARSYGSSIGSWFKKQYPKQNKTFEVYAIEADKAFYEEYRSKKAVTLLPYAAWVKNESLFFEVSHDPSKEEEKAKGKGMGRIKSVRSNNGDSVSTGVEIKGFDFADWLKKTVTEKDFVVMKMDVEGTEFELIPRLFESGAICLIDEIFLECHYNRWQRCCPGERSAKYEKTYDQCLDLFKSLRKSGVLVHQWW